MKPSSSKPPARVLQVPGLKPASRAPEPVGSHPAAPRAPKRKKRAREKVDADVPVPAPAPGPPAAADEPAASKKGEAADGRPAPRVLQIPGKASKGSEKRRFMSDKVSSIRSKPEVPKQKARKGKRGPDQEDSAEFKQALKDVLNFVMPQLGKSERIQYEKAKIRALGGTPDKPQYEPYAALQRRQKNEEAARQRRLAEEKHLGVSLSATQQRRGASADDATRRKKEALQAKKRRKDSDILAVGAKESRGMVIIPKNKAKSYS